MSDDENTQGTLPQKMPDYRLVKNDKWKTLQVNGKEIEIPEGWVVKDLGTVTTCLDNLRLPIKQEDRSKMKGAVPYWGANSIIDYVNDHLFDGKCILLGEDAAPFFDKTKKVAFISHGKIWPNNHVHVLQTTENYDFLLLQLNLFDYSTVLNTINRPKLTQAAMKSMEMIFPNLPEQTRIATILTKQEDLVSSIQSIIDLEEKRLAYLSNKLLSGRLLVRQKGESYKVFKNDKWKTVEVIGKEVEIPEGWELTTPEQLGFNIRTGRKDANAAKENGAYSFFTCSVDKILKIDTYSFDTEALLINGNGNVGEVKYYKGKFDAYQRVYVIDNIGDNIQFFRIYFANYFKKALNIQGGAMPYIKLQEISDFLMKLPPISEQTSIATIIMKQEDLVSSYKEMLALENKKLAWLIDNLLSGRYLVTEDTK